MKTIDVKSLIIGALLTSTIFLGVAATSPTDKWDDKQEWSVMQFDFRGGVHKLPEGYEPFAVHPHGQSPTWAWVMVRKRIK